MQNDETRRDIRTAYDHTKDKDRVQSIEIDFTDQKEITDELIRQFFDLPISQNSEMGVFLFGKRVITPDGRLTTIIESAFPSQSVDRGQFDLTSPDVADELADLFAQQTPFGREWLGIVHTHPTSGSKLHRENFSPRGQSLNPDENFHDDIIKRSPGILFGLAFKEDGKIKYKFLTSASPFNSPKNI